MAKTKELKPDVPTYRLGRCRHCGSKIAEIRDPYSGVLDWYSDGGDFGCDRSPETNEDGCGSHEPTDALRRAVEEAEK